MTNAIQKQKLCREMYRNYKQACRLDVFTDRCQSINRNISLEQLSEILNELTEKFVNFEKCRNLRLKHTEKCFNGEMDNGHLIQIKLLNKAINNCEENIKKITVLLEHKEKLLKQTKKTWVIVKKQMQNAR